MSKSYVLYNPLANNGRSRDAIEKLAAERGEECVLCDMTQGYGEYISAMEEGDVLILCGGDGTLNRFINENDVDKIENDILYFASGSSISSRSLFSSILFCPF